MPEFTIAGTRPAALSVIKEGFGPAVDVGFGALEVKDAINQGRNPYRAAGEAIAGILGGTTGAGLTGLLGLEAGPGAFVSALGGYTAGDLAARDAYNKFADAVFGEDKPSPEYVLREMEKLRMEREERDRQIEAEKERAAASKLLGIDPKLFEPSGVDTAEDVMLRNMGLGS